MESFLNLLNYTETYIMTPPDNTEEQEKKLQEMNYKPENDIFNQEESISLDGDGNPITNSNQSDEMPYGLDIPGSEDDDNFEQITDQLPGQEENLPTEDIIDDDLSDDDLLI